MVEVAVAALAAVAAAVEAAAAEAASAAATVAVVELQVAAAAVVRRAPTRVARLPGEGGVAAGLDPKAPGPAEWLMQLMTDVKTEFNCEQHDMGIRAKRCTTKVWA